jgi:hypothetical protein
MAARRLLIVMLVLLGISTLAAALVPQRTLNDETSSTGSTTTQPQTTAAEPEPGRHLTIPITVRPKHPPTEVSGPLCAPKNKKRCVPPLHVGDQVTLLVYSKPAAQLEFKEFGQFQFAAPNSPAQFELLPTDGGRFGILFASTNRVAARVEILTAKQAAHDRAKRRTKR